MTSLTKHQQEFWDILRLPYGIRGNCRYCVHMKPKAIAQMDCQEPEYQLTGAITCSARQNKPKWKWNGCIN